MTTDSNFRRWGMLGVLSLALAIIIIDTTLLNVSLGTIIREFKTDIQSIQWVITAYSLTLAALTITGGRLGDLFGRKRMFMLGAVLFALGSFIASISNNVTTMIIGESIIEGVGAALMMPATSSLLVANFRGRERAIAFGFWGAVAGASSAIGPILGGFLTTNFSWRWGFRINIFVVLILLLGSFLIKESRDTEEKPKLDWVGVFLSVVGLFSFVFGVIESSRYGWWTAKEVFTVGNLTLDFGGLSIVPVAMIFGLVVLSVFLWWERLVVASGNTPLVSLKIFKNQQFTSGILVTALMSLGMTGLIFILPVFFQSVRNLDALHTGLALLPMSATVFLTAPLSGFLSSRFNPKTMIQAGLILTSIAYLVMWSSLNVNSTVLSLAPGFILFGAGLGLTIAPLSNLTLSSVSVQESGEASGLNNTFRQIGSTFGAAILGAVLLSSLSTHLTSGINESTKIPENIKTPIIEQVSRQTSQIEFGGTAQLGNLPIGLGEELVKISKQASVDANKETILYGFGFALLGVVVSFFLPKIKNVEKNESLASH